MFRPIAAPKSLPGPAVRRFAAEIVRAHGRDTLSFFKLRADKHYFFNADRTAFVGYRVEAGVMLLSGDPVGPRERFRSCSATCGRSQRPRAEARRRRRERADAAALRGLGLQTHLPRGTRRSSSSGAFSLEGRPDP